MPNKKPIDEKKLVFKQEDYMTALYCILQSLGIVVINANAFKELSNCKDKNLVEYNEDKNCYRLRLKKKPRRGIIKPNKKIIAGISQTTQ